MGCCNGIPTDNEIIAQNIQEIRLLKPSSLMSLPNESDQIIAETPMFGSAKPTTFVFETKEKDQLEIN